MVLRKYNVKKYTVLFVLFVFPILIYLFFASGSYYFARLPVLKSDIHDIDTFSSLKGEKVSLSGKITILAILGDHVETQKTNLLNINEKIYKRFYRFTDLQFVVILLKGTEPKALDLLKELNVFSDTSKWHFLFGNSWQIKDFYSGLKLPSPDNTLNLNLSTPKVFIIDKNKSLRGRKGDEQLYGYDATSIAEINNKMLDDVKVIIAEYRLELKKYKNRHTKTEL